jgi:hypothetical protein
MSDLQAIADRFEIEALRGEFTDAVMMRDYGRVASLFTPDAAWRMPNIPVEGAPNGGRRWLGRRGKPRPRQLTGGPTGEPVDWSMAWGSRSLAGVNGRPGAVTAPAGDGPGEEAGARLFQPPARRLLGLMVATAQWSEIALASEATTLEWRGVVEVALAGGTAAAGEGAGLLPDPDQVLQRRRWPVGR